MLFGCEIWSTLSQYFLRLEIKHFGHSTARPSDALCARPKLLFNLRHVAEICMSKF